MIEQIYYGARILEWIARGIYAFYEGGGIQVTHLNEMAPTHPLTPAYPEEHVELAKLGVTGCKAEARRANRARGKGAK